jgi:hypothetical protein
MQRLIAELGSPFASVKYEGTLPAGYGALNGVVANAIACLGARCGGARLQFIGSGKIYFSRAAMSLRNHHKMEANVDLGGDPIKPLRDRVAFKLLCTLEEYNYRS